MAPVLYFLVVYNLDGGCSGFTFSYDDDSITTIITTKRKKLLNHAKFCCSKSIAINIQHTKGLEERARIVSFARACVCQALNCSHMGWSRRMGARQLWDSTCMMHTYFASEPISNSHVYVPTCIKMMAQSFGLVYISLAGQTTKKNMAWPARLSIRGHDSPVHWQKIQYCY